MGMGLGEAERIRVLVPLSLHCHSLWEPAPLKPKLCRPWLPPGGLMLVPGSPKVTHTYHLGSSLLAPAVEGMGIPPNGIKNKHQVTCAVTHDYSED